MKRLLISRIFLFLLVIVSELICMSTAKWVDCAIKNDVYVLSYKQENQYFTDDKIADMQKKGICLTYAYELYPEVSNGIYEQDATVILTNDNYAYFTDLKLCTGAFFNDKQVGKKLPVAVLNKTAAYSFFGNENCIGETIYLDKNAYKIIGVADTENVSRAEIFVPDSIIQVQSTVDKQCKQIWCSFSNMAEASLSISKAGILLSDLEIMQMNLYKNVFQLRYYIPLIAVGMGMAIIFGKKIIMLVKKNSVVSIERKRWLLLNLNLVLLGVFLFLTVWIFRIGWCVPPYYILAGENGWELLYSVLDFYALAGVDVAQMNFLNHWNELSLVGMIICMFGLFGFTKSKKLKSELRKNDNKVTVVGA